MSALFSPIEIKGVRFSSRVVMPPMATDQAGEDGRISEGQIAYYRRMAGIGMALLVVEHNFALPEGRVSGRQMSIARDTDVEGHRQLANAIHACGVPAALQISHSGSNRLNPPFTEGSGASAVPHPSSGITPRELSTADLAELVAAFGRAARRGREAGYDMVEVHCAHGYLLSQFLSPLTNRRHDRYGGGMRNRMRLLLEVVEEARGAVGGSPLMVRLGLADNPPGLLLFPGGLEAEEGILAAKALEESKIDILDLSAGICGSRPKEVSGEAYYLAFAQAVREKVKLPLIITGGITRPQTAEAIIASKKADFVGVGRALAADPEWIRQARQVLK